jgi:hypothetical protein
VRTCGVEGVNLGLCEPYVDILQGRDRGRELPHVQLVDVPGDAAAADSPTDVRCGVRPAAAVAEALPTSWSPWPAHGSYTPPKLSSTSTPESTLSRQIRPSPLLVPSFPLWSQLLEAPGRWSHQYRSSHTSRGCTRSPNNRFSSCSRSVRLQIVFSSRTARGRHHSCCCSTMGTDRPEPFSHYSGTRCSYPSLMSQHTSSPSTPSKPSSTLLA